MSMNFKKINEKRKENAEKAAAFDAYQLNRATPPTKEQVESMFVRWAFHPDQYIDEYLRIGLAAAGYSLTNQQRALCRDLGKMIKWNYFKNELDRGRIEKLPDSISDLHKRIGVSCMAGVGVGKDALAAMLVMWFLDVFCDNSKIFCVAPRQEHLKTVLWPEIRKWANNRTASGEYCYLGHDWLLIEAEQIHKLNPEGKKVSACSQLVIPKSTDADELKAMLAGKHADNMMFIFDEASAIPDAVVDPIENTLTNFNNFIVTIFNPRKNQGWAVKTHTGHPDYTSKWIKARWSQEDCELITPDRIKESEEKYGGRNTDGFRVNVLGLPPIGGEAEVLIPFGVIQETMYREPLPLNESPRFLGCDIAGGKGADGTTLTVRQGYQVFPLIRVGNMADTVEAEDAIMEAIEQYDIDAVFIDSVGVGSGVYDRVKRRFRNTFGVIAGGKATDDKYGNIRDQLLWNLREWMMSGFACLPNDDELMTQMSDIGFSTDSGKIKVERKASMKKRLGGSPDELESLYMTFYKRDQHFRRAMTAGARSGFTQPTSKYHQKLSKMELAERNKGSSWLTR